MAIKPCDLCLKLSCDYRQYCMSLLVVIIVQMTSIWNEWIRMLLSCQKCKESTKLQYIDIFCILRYYCHSKNHAIW